MVAGFSLSVGDFWKTLYSQHLKTVAAVCCFFWWVQQVKFLRENLWRDFCQETRLRSGDSYHNSPTWYSWVPRFLVDQLFLMGSHFSPRLGLFCFVWMIISRHWTRCAWLVSQMMSEQLGSSTKASTPVSPCTSSSWRDDWDYVFQLPLAAAWDRDTSLEHRPGSWHTLGPCCITSWLRKSWCPRAAVWGAHTYIARHVEWGLHMGGEDSLLPFVWDFAGC